MDSFVAPIPTDWSDPEVQKKIAALQVQSDIWRHELNAVVERTKARVSDAENDEHKRLLLLEGVAEYEAMKALEPAWPAALKPKFELGVPQEPSKVATVLGVGIGVLLIAAGVYGAYKGTAEIPSSQAFGH